MFDLKKEAERLAAGATWRVRSGEWLPGMSLKGQLTAILVSLAEEAMRQCPVPGGLSDEEYGASGKALDLMQTSDQALYNRETEDALELAESFRRHCEHLHAVLRSPEGADWAAGYDAGRRAIARDVLSALAGGTDGMIAHRLHEARRISRTYDPSGVVALVIGGLCERFEQAAKLAEEAVGEQAEDEK